MTLIIAMKVPSGVVIAAERKVSLSSKKVSKYYEKIKYYPEYDALFGFAGQENMESEFWEILQILKPQYLIDNTLSRENFRQLLKHVFFVLHKLTNPNVFEKIKRLFRHSDYISRIEKGKISLTVGIPGEISDFYALDASYPPSKQVLGNQPENISFSISGVNGCVQPILSKQINELSNSLIQASALAYFAQLAARITLEKDAIGGKIDLWLIPNSEQPRPPNTQEFKQIHGLVDQYFENVEFSDGIVTFFGRKYRIARNSSPIPYPLAFGKHDSMQFSI